MASRGRGVPKLPGSSHKVGEGCIDQLFQDDTLTPGAQQIPYKKANRNSSGTYMIHLCEGLFRISSDLAILSPIFVRQSTA